MKCWNCANLLPLPCLKMQALAACVVPALKARKAAAERSGKPIMRKSNKDTRARFYQRFTKTLMIEEKCPECGKIFEHSSGDWGYMFKDKKFCSYKCMRAAERKAYAKEGRP